MPRYRPATNKQKELKLIKKTKPAMQWRRNCSLAIAALALASAFSAQAQQPAATATDAIYMYHGADRNQQLISKAQKEGTVTWYTTMAPTESRPLAAAFEKKYGIKVALWRAPGEQMLQRIITEAQARRFTFDIIESDSNQTEKLARENLISEFYSPFIADLPPSAIPSHRKWMPDRFNYIVAAYNTNKVKRADMPQSYEGFTDPKWKGRIALEASDFIWMDTVSGLLGKDKGPATFRKLADMQPDLRQGHPLLAKLIGAGEVQVGLTTYLANVESGKAHGEPIDWAPVKPVLAVSFSIALAKNAPHPYAALLLSDFILSPEGQGMLDTMGRFPASTKIKNKLINFPFTVINVNDSLDEGGKREKAWDALFVNRR
jgi:iron(III) transport system substrate-binding protein